MKLFFVLGELLFSCRFGAADCSFFYVLDVIFRPVLGLIFLFYFRCFWTSLRDIFSWAIILGIVLIVVIIFGFIQAMLRQVLPDLAEDSIYFQYAERKLEHQVGFVGSGLNFSVIASW